MANPQIGRLLLTPSPGSRAPRSPLSDEATRSRLRESGFDEESIHLRDKAAFIAYIAKLEAEVFEHQHQMGLLLMERKEWASKYEQIKASSESAEQMYKKEQAAHSCTLAEARKKEDGLKKALAVEKECLMNIEKALQTTRAECAETKLAAEIRLTEARNMVDDAQNKISESEAKLRAAESLQMEATRYHRAAERKVQEVEAREDDLRRRTMAFTSDCNAKEKEIIIERQSLHERQKILQQGQERLLDEQATLKRREDYISSRSEEIIQLEKELDASKENLERESTALNEEKSNLELKVASLSTREEAVTAKEALLNKKEQELLNLQEALASKESNAIKNLLADEETKLKLKQSEFEAELQRKCKVAEDEIENKRRAWELREVDLSHREDLILEKEHDLEVRSRALAEKEKDITETFNLLEEKEKNIIATEREVEFQVVFVQKEKEEINNMRLDLQQALDSLEDKRMQVDSAEENLEAMKNETNELMLLEMKLKEEIDLVRAEKLEILSDADKLENEKAKFETEWELIDEKREELRREAERVAEERETLSKYLKDERNSLKLEKDAMRDQYKRDMESFRVQQEAFVSEMEHERSEWFSKIQQERADLLQDIEMQKTQLENSFDKRCEEIESYLKDKEREFQQKRKNELQNINSLKEKVAKDLEHIAFEMKRLESERVEISQDRELREKEWSEINNSIEELKMQRKKLEEQRELLHADREKIHAQIEHLERLENFKMIPNDIVAAEMQNSKLGISRRKFYAKRSVKQQTVRHKNIDVSSDGIVCVPSKQEIGNASPSSATGFTWLKRCADLICKHSPKKLPISNNNRPLVSDQDANCGTAVQLNTSNGFPRKLFEENKERNRNFSGRQWMSGTVGEPKVILEVPSAVEEVKRFHTLESEIQADSSDSSAHSLSEHGFLVGKRRRDKSMFSNDGVDAPFEQKRNNKKGRKGENTSCSLLEERDAEGDTQPKALDDQAAISFYNTEGDAAEANVLVESVANSTGATCENTKTGNLVNQAKVQCLQKFVSELEQCVLPDGGSNGLTNSAHEENGMSSCREC